MKTTYENIFFIIGKSDILDEEEMILEVVMSKYNRQVKAMGQIYSNLQDGAYFYDKGIEAYREKDFTKAKRFLERAVSLEPMEPAFNCQLAIIHADLGDYHQSNEYLLKITDSNLEGELPECYFFLANNYANQGLFEHARKQALLYIEKAPEGEFLEDVEDLLELIQDEDDLFAEAENFLIRYELASHELKKHNYKKAITFFTDIIKEQPEYWMAHIRLAEAYYYDGNYKQAISILNALLSEDDNITARCHLMTYYYETGDKEKAKEILQTLKNVLSIDHEHSYSLAVALGKVGEHDLAYEGLARLQRNGYGDFPRFYFHLAVASFYTGRIEKAKNLWEKLTTLGNEVACQHIQALQKGESIEPSYHYNVSVSD